MPKLIGKKIPVVVEGYHPETQSADGGTILWPMSGNRWTSDYQRWTESKSLWADVYRGNYRSGGTMTL